MKKRIIWKMFLLEIITLGIYRLYWLIKTRNEMMKIKPSIKIKSPWFLLIPVIIIIAALIIGMGSLIYGASQSSKCPTVPVTSYTQSGHVVKTTVENNATINYTNCAPSGANTAGLIALLVFYLALPLAFVFYIIWLWGYCHGVEEITNEKTSFALALVIMILVPDGIDLLIIQDTFNKISDQAAPPPQTQQPLPPPSPMAPPAQPPQAPQSPVAPVQFQLA